MAPTTLEELPHDYATSLTLAAPICLDSIAPAYIAYFNETSLVELNFADPLAIDGADVIEGVSPSQL